MENPAGLIVDDMLPRVRALLIEGARNELLPRFREITRTIKADGSIVTAADTSMQSYVQQALAAQWPQYSFLGEEQTAEEQSAVLAAQSAAGCWCLDPLDGTTNFANGVPFFGVSLALLERGRQRYAWIYDPVRDECFTAVAGGGVFLNDNPLVPRRRERPLAHCLAVVDFKRLAPRIAGRLAQSPPYGSQRNLGSCALEWCWLAAGRVQLYVHGGQKSWDYAAGALILKEAGGVSATLNGEPILDTPLLPKSVVAAADPQLFALWQAWLRTHG